MLVAIDAELDLQVSLRLMSGSSAADIEQYFSLWTPVLILGGYYLLSGSSHCDAIS
jgi:hypothetical protein